MHQGKDEHMSTVFDPRAWKLLYQYRGTFLHGFTNTLESAVVALLISLVLGILFGLFATGESKILKCISRIYVEFFQNTPLMLQMLFLYYALAFGGFWQDKTWIPGATQILLTGMISIGLYHGAYISEVIRAGITAIPKGQFDAARSQGFGYVGTMYHIILPQTIKIILPPMVNQVVNLIKNTSCLYIVGGADLIATTYNFITGEATGGAYGPAYLLCGAVFFACCFPLSVLATGWERKLKMRENITVTNIKAADEISDNELDAIINNETGSNNLITAGKEKDNA